MCVGGAECACVEVSLCACKCMCVGVSLCACKCPCLGVVRACRLWLPACVCPWGGGVCASQHVRGGGLCTWQHVRGVFLWLAATAYLGTAGLWEF